MHHGYSETDYGQVHWRQCEQDSRSASADLYCLHPAPFSGLAFTSVMPLLASDYRVIAPDYPGHGGSAPLMRAASIDDYAIAVQQVANDLSGSASIDLVGFHTGCLVALAMAVRWPERIRRMVLIDVPAFDPQIRATLKADLGGMFEFSEALSCLAGPWERSVKRRAGTEPVERSVALFAEQLRHGTRMNAAFAAAFSYDVEAAFSANTRPTTIVATASALLAATRRAASLAPDAEFIERLDIQRSVLDESAEVTAACILTCLID